MLNVDGLGFRGTSKSKSKLSCLLSVGVLCKASSLESYTHTHTHIHKELKMMHEFLVGDGSYRSKHRNIARYTGRQHRRTDR